MSSKNVTQNISFNNPASTTARTTTTKTTTTRTTTKFQQQQQQEHQLQQLNQKCQVIIKHYCVLDTLSISVLDVCGS